MCFWSFCCDIVTLRRVKKPNVAAVCIMRPSFGTWKELSTSLANQMWKTRDSPPVPGVHPLPESRNKRFNIKSLALSDDVFEQPVQQLAAVLDVLVGVGNHTADCGEHLIEQGKDGFSRHLNKTVAYQSFPDKIRNLGRCKSCTKRNHWTEAVYLQ